MEQKSMEQLVAATLDANYMGLYRTAYQYVRNEQDALDIVQEAAYKATKHCSCLRQPEYVTTWLYRIVRNEAVTFLRKNKYDCVPWSEVDGEQEAQYADVDLERALQQLPEADKKVVVLRYFEGFSFQQIAQLLKENINTIKSRLYRALEKLRELLEEPKMLPGNRSSSQFNKKDVIKRYKKDVMK